MYNLKKKNFKVLIYFSGDLKFLLIFLGLKAANSNFPCLYCYVHKSKLDLIEESSRRAVGENENYIGKISNLGYKKESLIGEVIPFDRIIICTLHLRIRVFEILLKQLIKQISVKDQYDGINLINLNQHQSLTKWIYFHFKNIILLLKIKCKIAVQVHPYKQENTAGIDQTFDQFKRRAFSL